MVFGDGLMGSMTVQKPVINHEPDNARYVIAVEGEEAGYAEYADSGDVRDFQHTVVHERFQGQGLSKPLIKAALDDAASFNKRVLATCSAVARFIEKNETYKELLAH